MSDTYDIGIIGGGPAGLSAAAGIARQIHTVVLFDNGSYRNKGVSHMHTVPTWDHKNPADFRAAARADLKARYSTTDFVDTEIIKVEKIDDSNFKLEDKSGKTWSVRKLIIASGSDDIYPAIQGYEECWKRRIFHCLFCHGYEDRNAPSSGVLAVDFLAAAPMAMHVSRSAAQLSKSITFYTNDNDELASTIQKTIQTPPFSIDNRKITHLRLDESNSVNQNNEEGGEIILEFADGSSRTESFLVHAPLTKLKGPWAEQLDLKLTPTGDIVADPPFYQTSVRGVFAAGDCASMFKVANGAVMSGGFAAAGVIAQLQAEKWGHHAPF